MVTRTRPIVTLCVHYLCRYSNKVKMSSVIHKLQEHNGNIYKYLFTSIHNNIPLLWYIVYRQIFLYRVFHDLWTLLQEVIS